MVDSAKNILLRFAPMIYGPTALFAMGEGAVIPLIPIVATKLGADIALSGLIASVLVVGQLIGNLPAGWFVARFGERATMAIAGTLAMLGVLGIIYSPGLQVLAAAVFLVGFCAAAFGLARHAFMTTRVPLNFRARSLALLGGSFRLGMFAGPFVAALLLGITGTSSSAGWFFIACLVATVLLVLLGPDPEKALLQRSNSGLILQPADTGEAITGSIDLRAGQSAGVFATMRQYRRVLARLGLAAASLSAVRSARQVVLPLWGVSVGLDAQSISLVVGIAGAIDFALFYASGQVMDKFGRLWAVLPAMVLMGAGFGALALTHDLTQAQMWFAMLAAVIGVGNGLSSGILLTLGADVAPQRDPAAFLGSWRMLSDAGGAAAPVLFSVITAVSTIGVATGTIGLISLLGAYGFARWVPMFISRNDQRAGEASD